MTVSSEDIHSRKITFTHIRDDNRVIWRSVFHGPFESLVGFVALAHLQAVRNNL